MQHFIKYICNLSSKKGYYFNDHYMHELIQISKITVPSSLIKIISSYIGIMKSIEVYDAFNFDKLNDGWRQSCFLLDKIELKVSVSSQIPTNNNLWFYFIDNDWEHINKVYEPFKKLNILNLILIDSDEKYKQLEIVRKAKLRPQEILFHVKNSEELQHILNPDNYISEVRQFHLYNAINQIFSEEVLENFQAIVEKKIWARISLNSGFTINYDSILINFMNFLSKITWASISVCISNIFNWVLEFKNTVVKVRKLNNEFIFISWRKFKASFNTFNLNTDYWLNHEDDTNENSINGFIYFGKIDRFEFDEYHTLLSRALKDTDLPKFGWEYDFNAKILITNFENKIYSKF